MIKRVLLAISLVVISFSIVGQSLVWTDVIQQANQGDTKSMYVYSYYSIYGEEYGITKDYSGAVAMLNKLVSQKPVTDYVIMGYELLGDCYEKGYGVTENIDTAVKWWTLAVDNGSEDAKNKLNKYKPIVVPDLARLKSEPKPESKSAPEKIFTAVDQKAAYPGGDAALQQWISSNIQYPTMAQEEGIEGRVIVQFVVEKDGSIGNVEVARGKHKDLDAEAVCVVKKIPKKFTPAKQNGQIVRSWVTLPVTFKLAGKESKDVSTTVNGVSFKMVYVKGGSFQMGSNDVNADDNEKPLHSVTLSDYCIGETEVTQELWEAVMGSNPSYFKNPKNPVESVSWNDCQLFIQKLNQLTGMNFSFPTEAEWEYAARGGNMQKTYVYSGSDDIEEIAWYARNAISSAHQVATKKANSLSLYDMSGNVWEWCSDWYDKGYYSSSPSVNPVGPTTGSNRVLRGGSWINYVEGCGVAYRYFNNQNRRSENFGLRLVLREEQSPSKNESKIKEQPVSTGKNGSTKEQIAELGSKKSQTPKNYTEKVKGVSIKMIYVEGGIFKMGSNDRDAERNEKPVRSAAVSDYYIGETEVPQELWVAVMGNNPSVFKGTKNPVDNVSWNECQEFIKKLNKLTGKNFSLPTEAEWEYAARGGNKSRGYKYSGSDNIDDVAWYDINANEFSSKRSSTGSRPVSTKYPNELGIYDMSGNIYEWCDDLYRNNSTNSKSNPERVIRGGSWYNFARASRVSYCYGYKADYSDSSCGLRLVLHP